MQFANSFNTASFIPNNNIPYRNICVPKISNYESSNLWNSGWIISGRINQAFCNYMKFEKYGWIIRSLTTRNWCPTWLSSLSIHINCSTIKLSHLMHKANLKIHFWKHKYKTEQIEGTHSLQEAMNPKKWLFCPWIRKQ